MVKQKQFAKLIIGITLLLLAVPVTGISGCDNTPYKVMSVREGISSFSFEYPDVYTLIHLNLENTQSARYSEVGLSASRGDSLSEIYVYLWFPGPGTSSAEEIMDNVLQSGGATLKNFSLVSRDTVMLGDTVSIRAVFTADSASDNSDIPAIPRPATYRVTSFITSGVAVEIDMTCDTDLTEETADQYQHLLDTFTVMD